MLSFLNDITARKAAEAALRESEEKYRLLVEHQTDLLVKMDPDWNLLFASPSYCETAGVDEAGLLGRRFEPAVHEEECLGIPEIVEKLSRPPFACRCEHRMLTTSGCRWFSWSFKSMLDSEHRVTAIVGVGHDVTARKGIEEHLRLSNEALEAEQNNLCEKNIALRQVLQQIETEKLDTAGRIQSNLDRLVIPLLMELSSGLSPVQRKAVEVIRQNLLEITSPFVNQLESLCRRLSTREVDICYMIRRGMSSKEIAASLGISIFTVHNIRARIRRKLGLVGEHDSLPSHLQSL